MTTTATVKTTVHIERNSKVRVHVSEEGAGMAYLTMATGDLTFGLAVSGPELEQLIADLQAIAENVPAETVPAVVTPDRLSDVLDRIRVA